MGTRLSTGFQPETTATGWRLYPAVLTTITPESGPKSIGSMTVEQTYIHKANIRSPLHSAAFGHSTAIK